MSQIRYLATKNLAGLLAPADASAHEALDLYCSAAEMDQDDVVLWNRLGTLVSVGLVVNPWRKGACDRCLGVR